MIDCIASVHTNSWTCGIAKWNHALAERLGVLNPMEVIGVSAI